MSTSSLLQSQFKYKAWANKELFTELEKVDAVAHQSDRHKAIRLLNHIYVVERIFAAHLSGEAHTYTATNTLETPSFEELRSAVAKSDNWYVEYVSKLAPELLPELIQFSFTDGERGCMSREEMLVHIIIHGSYHRGAVGQIMTQMSVAPPRDTFTVFLHKSEPRRRE